MKKIILVIVIFTNFIFFAQNNVAQKKEIVTPIEVKLAFEKEFSKQTANWQMEYRGNEQLGYMTNVIFEKKYAMVFYDKLGILKAIEVEIRTRELPEEVINYLEKNYSNRTIYRTAKVYRENKSKITYEVGIQENRKLVVLVFDIKGYFLTRIEKNS